MYILTNNSTDKCLEIERDVSGKTYDKEAIFYNEITDISADKISTDTFNTDGTVTREATNYTNGNFNFVNKVFIWKGNTYNPRVKNSIVELDLLNDNYAWSSAPTVKLTDAGTLRDTLLGIIAAYK